MTNPMLRIRQVMQQTGYSRSTLYDYIQRGLFPAPVKMGERVSAWPAREISAITAARTAGKPARELLALVKTLHAQRQASA